MKLLVLLIFFLSTCNLVFYASAQSEDIAVLNTNSGRMFIEFFPEEAPNHVDNFLKLTREGYYDDTIFHRIIWNSVIQGGAEEHKEPKGDYLPDYKLDAEFNDISHLRGVVSMARANDPNSAREQFFIVHRDFPYLDGKYSAFGKLIGEESFETLDKIAEARVNKTSFPFEPETVKITKAEIITRSEFNEMSGIKENENSIDINLVENSELNMEKIREDISLNLEDPSNNIDGKVTLLIYSDGPYEGSFVVFDDFMEISGNTSEKYSLECTDEEYAEAYFDSIGEGILYIALIKDGFLLDADFTEETDGFVEVYKNCSTEELVNATEISEEEISQELDKNGGGCLIATATFGTELAPQVQQLRELRDNSLLNTDSGRVFMTGFNQFYYSFSPTIADLERQNPIFKEIVKITITPMVSSLSLLNYVNMDSEYQVVGYGIGIILMNIGMYVGIPSVVIISLRKKN